MATQVRAGVVLRRGAAKLTASELKWLMDNEGEVERVIKDIDDRRALYQKAEQAAQARVAEAEKAEAGLTEHEVKLLNAREVIEAETAEDLKRHQSDMDALSRRTLEVVDKETAAQGVLWRWMRVSRRSMSMAVARRMSSGAVWRPLRRRKPEPRSAFGNCRNSPRTWSSARSASKLPPRWLSRPWPGSIRDRYDAQATVLRR